MKKSVDNSFTEEYDMLRVERLRRILQSHKDKGSPKYYKITVDNVPIVEKTSDLNQFDSFEEFVDDKTQEVVVYIYSENEKSWRYQKYVFKVIADHLVNEPSQQSQRTLQGFSEQDLENKLNEKLAREKEKMAAEQRDKEFEQTKTQLTEAEEYIDKLQEQLKECKAKKINFGSMELGEVASAFLSSTIRRNPKILSAVPGGDSLAGLFDGEGNQTSATPLQDANVSFKKKTEGNAVELTEEEKGYMQLFRQLEECFDEEQLMTIMKVLESLMHDSTQLNPVAELLNISKV